MVALTELKDKEDLPENVNKKVYVLTMKWKKEMDEWQKNPSFSSSKGKSQPAKESPFLKDANFHNNNEDPLKNKRPNPKYLEKESRMSSKDTRLAKETSRISRDKKRNSEREKNNKKKGKYERKKESSSHYQHRSRSHSKGQKRKDGKKKKLVKFI